MIDQCPVCGKKLVYMNGVMKALKCPTSHSVAISHFSWILEDMNRSVNQINFWKNNSYMRAHFNIAKQTTRLSFEARDDMTEHDIQFDSVKKFYRWFKAQQSNLVFQ